MYKILNYLFGWDYISWNNSADQGIALVHVTEDGDIYYWRYKTINLLDKILKPDQVIWLTCHSSKYFPQPTGE